MGFLGLTRFGDLGFIGFRGPAGLEARAHVEAPASRKHTPKMGMQSISFAETQAAGTPTTLGPGHLMYPQQ